MQEDRCWWKKRKANVYSLCAELRREPKVQVYYDDCCSYPANMTFLFTFYSHSIFVQTYFVGEKMGCVFFGAFTQFHTFAANTSTITVQKDAVCTQHESHHIYYMCYYSNVYEKGEPNARLHSSVIPFVKIFVSNLIFHKTIFL